MDDLKKIKEVCEDVLETAVPREEERHATLSFSRKLAEKLSGKLRECGVDAEVQVQGSIAKDTWLAGEKDIDMFMLLPKTFTRDDLPRALDIVKEVAGENWLEAYAEHPYIEAKMDGYTVDFVPAFKIEKAEEAKSSVDRTPLHTQYVQKRLDQKAKNEIRLLKKFMRGTGTYGAEIKVGGFSGYLCEILTLFYGSFYDTLVAASKWRRREVIDIERHYEGEEDETRKIFQDNLIVIDPVDRGRNVSSAVRKEKLNEFIAAAQWFLKKPHLRFFIPEETEPFSARELTQAMTQRGSALIFLRFGAAKAVPDILWGQLYRSHRALGGLIGQYDFEILRDCVWSDEEAENIFLLELNSRFLPSVKKHLGPPLEKKEDSEKFLHKHLRSKKTISGPYVEGDRWVVETRRDYVDVVSLLENELKMGGRELGIADLVSESLARHFEVLVNEEILGLYQWNRGFAKFLSEYLNGRPRWLQ